MTETKNPGEKLSLGSTKTLTLKRSGETGVVRQSFSHGRTKPVVVEKVKRRVIGGEPKAEAAPAAAERAPTKGQRGVAAKAAAAAAAAQTQVATPTRPSGVVLRTLTEEERSARAHALADARVREAEERRIAEEEASRRSGREEAERIDREAAEARKREEDERRRH
jgi:translation initiation factor IF-2